MADDVVGTVFVEDWVKNNNTEQQNYADQYNRERYSWYSQTIENINRSLDAGRPAPMDAPTVPTKMILTDPDPKTGLQWAEMSDEPIGPVIPLHPDLSKPIVKTPNTIDIGKNIGGKWFSVGPMDTFPVGATTPPILGEDGAPHMYEKFAAPVGAGWYLQVS